ncbi:GGDEF domain-containing protein [Clostridium beijerinckii]|uniref:GGDEF domain-containing protein n=1 Tax=Clostridium beijerinckii TaxID=1520 RepID=UPI0013611637|nr:diguanylate cyclase [Clostridium beijerinckii]MZK52129.1 diguanylate cyclase [Clostridium beijerinckii]MZK61693.1 diguanylate cyclase [Clostridium beijerinckii]MZK71493.1 diguanylate cyclase [Clostridium beijerinckii]MZK76852.1 diguanylate cyclase [Clostridium beijerinckii]MZK85522.1 diguanylate cyclase [Clostridium beijerinckii]
MVNDLFINVLLLISVTFIGGHILKEVPSNTINNIYFKILLGISGGLVGILLMIYSIRINGTTTILDLRNFIILMVSYVGGVIPTIFSAIIIGLYRILHFGISKSSIMAIFQLILYVICFYIIDKRIKSDLKKWIFKTLVMLITLAVILNYLLNGVENTQLIVFKYFMVNIFFNILEYFLINYAKYSNELYRMYKKNSTKDFLTGLNNVRNFDRFFNDLTKKAKEKGETISLLMIDIDFFKIINDTYGHTEGDIVLRELGKILTKNCRKTGIVSRNGGEEFTILLPDCSKNQAIEIAECIRSRVENHTFILSKGNKIKVTISIGIANYPKTTSEIENLIESADAALYGAKSTGRNKVCLDSSCS